MGAELDTILANITAFHKEKRETKKAKPTPEAWQKIWIDELKQRYPAYVIMYSDAVAANLKRAVKSRGLPVEEVGPFIKWIVNNWEHIRKHVLSNNPKRPWGPPAPDMKVVISMLPQMFGKYNLSKPQYALSTPMPNPRNTEPLQPSKPKPLLPQASQNKVSAPLPARPTALSKPVPRIDMQAAETARKRLNLPKWD